MILSMRFRVKPGMTKKRTARKAVLIHVRLFSKGNFRDIKIPVGVVNESVGLIPEMPVAEFVENLDIQNPSPETVEVDVLGEVDEDILQVSVREIRHMIPFVFDRVDADDVTVIIIQFRGGVNVQIGLVGAGTRDEERCDEGEDD
jgi:hypothetical protein